MRKLSVIIPFLDEGSEVIPTLESLFSTTKGNLVEVIVVNDGSKESFEDKIKKFDVTYLKNPCRMGVAASRDIGVRASTSNTAVFFDAHMRFRNDGWAERILDEVLKDPHSIYCTTCASLKQDKLDVHNPSTRGYGADINLVTSQKGSSREILEPSWISVKKNEIVYDIPCILGATYAFNVPWYKKLRGLGGLKSWGSDEIYLSFKYWLAGGSCKLISDVEIGHIFRDQTPYLTNSSHLYFNKMFICFVLFPQEVTFSLIDRLPQDDTFSMAIFLFRREVQQIIEYKKYYENVFVKTFSQVCELLNLRTV